MRRSNNFNERFSREMKNPEYAQEYILQLMNDEDEPMTVEDSLRFVIEQMGTTEFSELVNLKAQTVDKFLKGERNPKRETLDKFLRPFGLETALGVKKVEDEKVA